MARLEWRMPAGVYSRYLDLRDQLDRTPEGSADWYALQDDLRSLPGFPFSNDPDHDVIVPVVTTVRS